MEDGKELLLEENPENKYLNKSFPNQNSADDSKLLYFKLYPKSPRMFAKNIFGLGNYIVPNEAVLVTICTVSLVRYNCPFCPPGVSR